MSALIVENRQNFFWLDPHEISAIATDDSGKWLSVPEKVFLDLHIPGIDGEILPGGDIVYTEITRKI